MLKRTGYDRVDLTAIAVGGVLGAAVRWLATRSSPPDGGWFVYEPRGGLSPNGGAFGTVRSAELVASGVGIPIDTLAVNLAGCLMLGAVAALLARSVRLPRRALIAAAGGFCGSLTTFSTFAVELAVMLRGEPLPSAGLDLAIDRQPGAAALYVTVSVVGGGLAFWLGRRLAHAFTEPPATDVRPEAAT